MKKTKRNKNKNFFYSILSFFTMVLIFYLIFRNSYEEIIENIKTCSKSYLIVILALGIMFQVLESFVCLMLVRRKVENFTFKQAFEVTFLGIFTIVTTLAVGTLPARTTYLHHRGVGIGEAIGIMNMEYVFHKSSILLWSGVFLIINGKYIYPDRPNLIPYTAWGFFICIVIVIVLILVCTWNTFYNLIIKGIESLEKKPKWKDRGEKIKLQVEAMHDEARDLIKSPETILKALALNAAKLFCFYIIPYLCAKAIGVDALPLMQMMTLASLTHVIASAIPNIAGMGPLEAAFILLFSYYMKSGEAKSMLVLFRLATYFAPFIVSSVVASKLRIKLYSDEEAEA